MRKSRIILIFFATLFAACGVQAEKSEKFGVSFSIEDRNKVKWTIIYPEEETKRSREEEAELLEETIFPEVHRSAKAGALPAAWQVGFFHFDGKGTEKNLRKAEDAFRIGLQHQEYEGALMLAGVYRTRGLEENSIKDFQKSEDLSINC